MLVKKEKEKIEEEKEENKEGEKKDEQDEGKEVKINDKFIFIIVISVIVGIFILGGFIFSFD